MAENQQAEISGDHDSQENDVNCPSIDAEHSEDEPTSNEQLQSDVSGNICDQEEGNSTVNEEDNDAEGSSADIPSTLSRGFDFEVISEQKLAKFQKLVWDIVAWYTSANENNKIWPVGCHSDNQKRAFKRKAKRFRYDVVKRVLYLLKQDTEGLVTWVQVIADPDRQREVMRGVHEGYGVDLRVKAMSGHHGRDKTASIISARYYFPMIYARVMAMIKYCEVCQTMNSTRLHKSGAVLHPVQIPNQIWVQIGVDLIGPLPQCQGMRYIMTAVDYLTKWVEAYPIEDKTARNVVEVLLKLLCRYGCTQINITDQGREFNNELMKEYYALTETEHRITAAYHPQTNGLVERSNRTIEDTIRKYVVGHPDWVTLLDSVLFSIRVAKHSSSKYSPYRLLFGRDPILPIQDKWNEQLDDPLPPHIEEIKEKVVPSSEDAVPDPDELNNMYERMDYLHNTLLAKAKKNSKRAQASQAKYYNIRNMAQPFEVGDKVLKKVHGIGKLQKWQGKKWQGRKWMIKPYTVLGRTELGNYILKNSDGKRLQQSVPPAHVKAYHQLPPEQQENPSDDSDAFDFEDDQLKSVKKSGPAPARVAVPGDDKLDLSKPKRVPIAGESIRSKLKAYEVPKCQPSTSRIGQVDGDQSIVGEQKLKANEVPPCMPSTSHTGSIGGDRPTAARQLFAGNRQRDKTTIIQQNPEKERVKRISPSLLAQGLAALKRPSADFFLSVSPKKKQAIDPNIPVSEIPIVIVDEDADDDPNVNITVNETKPDEKPVSYKDMTLETHGIQDMGKTKSMVSYFRPLTLVQRRNIARNVFNLVFDSQANKLLYSNCGQLLVDERPRVQVRMAGDDHCFFHTISYLLTGDQKQHHTVRSKMMDYMEAEGNFARLNHHVNQADGKLYGPDEASAYIADNKMRHNGWATQVELHCAAHMSGKDLYCHYKGEWLCYAASGNLNDRTYNAFYIVNTGIHYNAVVGQ